MAVEKFQSAGASTWKCPVAVRYVQIEAWGGGGNGGSAGSPAGGGGGAYSKKLKAAVVPGMVYSYTVGDVAGDSFFKDLDGSTNLALAKAGTSASGTTRGQGGAASSGVGDTKNNGGIGGTGNGEGATGSAGGGGGAAPWVWGQRPAAPVTPLAGVA